MGNLVLDGLGKRFEASVAVERVDLDVPQGQMVALLGPCGCGKTTTLRMVAGFVPPSEFGTWPTALPAQIHGMSGDPEFAESGDLAAAEEFAAAAPSVELFVYPGDQHLFVDSPLADFRPVPAALFGERTREFLDRVGAAAPR